MYLVSVMTEFAAGMIYLVCTFLLKSSAISHVEQMHEELDIGIAVMPGARGSTLTVLPGR